MLFFFCLLFVFYLWHMMGVTIGYHRLLSHRSFRCPRAVEYFWVLGGYLAFEGSPIWWSTMHRAHHRHTDTPLDPHSPRYGWLKAHIGWVLDGSYPEHIDPQTQAKDLVRDPIYRFLEQGGNWYRAFWLNMAINFAVRLVMLVCFGWVVALASLVAAIAVQHLPLMLNVVCHKPRLGYRNYATTDDSVNIWWVALLTMGEGWHNNHHAFPGSSRSGIKAHELDVSWLTLRVLKLFGMVGWMNEPSAAAIARVSPAASPVTSTVHARTSATGLSAGTPSANLVEPRKAPALTLD